MNKSAEIGVMGGNSMAIGRFSRFAAIFSNKYSCLTIGINQTRADMSGYNRVIVPGGHAWLHACTLRIHLKRGREKVEAVINGEKMQVGYNVVAKIIKNQLSAPGRTAWWWLYYVPTEQYGPIGIDTLDEVIRLAVLTKVVTQAGAMYSHPALPDGKVRGKDALAQAIRDDEALKATIVSETMAILAAPDADLSEIAPIADDPEGPIDADASPFGAIFAGSAE